MNEDRDRQVTDEKIAEVVRRIVAVADPLQVILFGSRARGDYRVESDLDLAVILDSQEEQVDSGPCWSVLSGLKISVDLVVVSKLKYDEFRPWMNSVFNYIQEEGVVLYDRDDPKSAGAAPVSKGGERRIDSAISAA